MTAIGYKRLEAFVEIEGEKFVIGHLAFPLNAVFAGTKKDGSADVYVTVGKPEFEKCHVYNVEPNERRAIDEYQANLQLEINAGRMFPWL